MKIFNKEGGWERKVNFVDDNNVVLGYDLGQSCCEHADWFIADVPTIKTVDRNDTPDGTPSDMEGWNFDPNYLKQESNSREFDEGAMAIFRIVKGDQEKFVHIFNSHNGYYGHGFTFQVGQNAPTEGGL
jgi:hypothetical protein